MSAMAGECLLNCLIPALVLSSDSRSKAIPPSKFVVSASVFLFNVLGSYLQGRCKRDNDRLTGFSNGFLSVLTSFPDVGESASDIVGSTSSYHLGGFYCFFGMLVSSIVYANGCKVSNHSNDIFLQPRRWHTMCCFVIVLSLLVCMLFPSAPVDFSRPDLTPPVCGLVGLAIGSGMSISGAIIGTLIVEYLPHQELWARFVNNLASCIFVLWTRIRAQSIGHLGFFALKFMTAFCGALSNYSGTIGDVMEEYRKQNPRKGVSNFVIHFVMCLALMIVALHLVTEEAEVGTIIIPTKDLQYLDPRPSQPWHHRQLVL